NPETCYGFWMQNGADCSNCIRSCPYNKPNNFLHRFVLWFTQNAPWLNRLVVKMDDLAGFGRQRGTHQFWKKIRS
ncbi:MAG: reductive dehalogenase, partial [Candidatus Thorarchaeota archaeon]